MLTESSQHRIEFNPDRCTQCGGCLAACKTGNLRARPAAHGRFTIYWHEEGCTHCLACTRTCPAPRIARLGFNPQKMDSARNILLAAARDSQIRRQSSSGGACRVIVKTALDSGLADKSYTLKNMATYPWAEGCFWRRGDDISSMPNSMYLPIPVLKNLRIKDRLKSLLIVGTPCQLIAAEALAGKKAERIFKVAIFCKQQKDFRATEYFAKRLKIHNGDKVPGIIKSLTFRGEGWPGRVKINQRDLAWEQAAGVPFGKRLWRVPGCRFCPDPFGIDVDLTLMDPWGVRHKNTFGETLAIVWTPEGHRLLQTAAGELEIVSLGLETGKRSMNINDMCRKAVLVDYYSRRPVSPRTMLAGISERFQIKSYESLLERYSLPAALHKLIAHIPDFRDLILSDSQMIRRGEQSFENKQTNK